MNIVQTFYDNLANNYDKLFENWQETVVSQGVILNKIFCKYGYSAPTSVLDCACGIGTQAIGLALQGYNVTASDISNKELKQAKIRAKSNGVEIYFNVADFCALQKVYSKKFNVVIAIDNALPHMLTKKSLSTAVKSISNAVEKGGIFVASIRDYDEILKTKPTYSPPYIHQTKNGQRVAFQTWKWSRNKYKLSQYVIEDENQLKVNKYDCEYRAVTRRELSALLVKHGFNEVTWLFPKNTGFYQPIVVAKKI